MTFVDEFYVWSSVGDVRPFELLVYDRSSRSRPSAERFRRNTALEKQLVPRLRDLSAHRRAIVSLQETIEGRRRIAERRRAAELRRLAERSLREAEDRRTWAERHGVKLKPPAEG